MNVRHWRMMGLAIAIVAAAGQAVMADDTRPSQQTLAQMGLGGMTVMSDSAAMSVRGKGFTGNGNSHGSMVAVAGSSFATYEKGGGVAHSQNIYAASGKHSASGSNLSFAGVIQVSTGGGHKGGNNKPPTRNGSTGGNYGGGGGNYGGGINIKAKVFFAGGYSSAHAW